MELKWIGVILILGGCGGFGFSAATAVRKENRMLQEFLRALQLMETELQYRMSSLPDLCRQAGRNTTGTVRDLARELDWQTLPDAKSCMAEAIEKSHLTSTRIRQLFLRLGSTLGCFDLPGQLKELGYLRISCENHLMESTRNQERKGRNYQTLGLCTGAALAILLL